MAEQIHDDETPLRGDTRAVSATSTSSSTSSSSTSHSRTKVGVLLLTVLAFLSDQAGPYGVEEVLAAVGPAGTVWNLILIPLVVSLPLIVMMKEVMFLMPSNDGFLRWVAVAYPPPSSSSASSRLDNFLPLLNAVFLALTNIVDVAGYSVLACSYLLPLVYGDGAEDSTSFGMKYAIRATVILLAGSMSFFSLKEQGWVSALMALMIMGPFVAGIFVAPLKLEGWMFTETLGAGQEVSLGSALSVGLWLYAGNLVSSCVCEEAESPSDLATSWYLAVPLEMTTYLIPVLTMLPFALPANEPRDWTQLDDGGIVTAFKRMSAPLGVAVGVAAVISNVALFSSCLVFSVRLITSMADIGWLPRRLLGANRYGSEWKIVLLHMIIALILNLFDFQFIIAQEIVLSAFSHLIFVSTFLRLRLHPERCKVDEKRESDSVYRAPFESDWSIFLSSAPRIILYFAAAGATLTDWRSVLFLLGCLALTWVLFEICTRNGTFETKRWRDFCSLEVERHVAMDEEDDNATTDGDAAAEEEEELRDSRQCEGYGAVVLSGQRV